MTPNEKKRVLFILHSGLVEIRNLALASNNRQIAALADALEIIPTEFLVEDSFQRIINYVEDYQKKYESRYPEILKGLDISDEQIDNQIPTRTTRRK